MNPIDNLKPVRTTEEAKARGKQGGIKSGEAKRKKKLMSELYADFLIKEHDLEINGVKEKLSGQKLVSMVMSEVLLKGDSASVSLLKELRSGTEGDKLKVEADITINKVSASSVKVEDLDN